MAKRNLRKLLHGGCLLLIMTLAGSCTFDYFVDETNFRLIVPQMEKGEITHLYVAFHKLDNSGEDGSHVLTRKISAPFDRDSMRSGVLRFKLPVGQYDVSVFADHDRDLISEGLSLATSYKGARPLDEEKHIYTPTPTTPRAVYLRNVSVYPMGHPDARIEHRADLIPETRFKGKINCRFEDLPPVLTDIRITYKGHSTRYDFDGVFRNFHPEDITQADFNTVTSLTSDGAVVCSSMLFPSTGSVHAARSRSDDPQNIALYVEFFSNGFYAGNASFTQDDLLALAPDKRPVDEEGNPITQLVLHPRSTITFTFKGFTLIGIDLVGWGDIDTGDTIIH